jgi:hypothetical protein
MPDKDPKNIEKLQEQAEEKHEEQQEWKQTPPEEKTAILEQEDAEDTPDADDEA